jgi:phosphotransferase family enzyme
MRLLWRAAERCGALAPVYGVARRGATPDGPPDSPDELGELLPAPDPWVLLTGGQEDLNKIVGLPFAKDPSTPPSVVVKFARVEGSDSLLEREAEVLRRLEEERPELPGVPRLRAVGRRAGRLAIAQSAAHGRRLETALTASNFADLAPPLTRWLLALAGSPAPRPASEWAARLAWKPLEQLQDRYPGVLKPKEISFARGLLSDLDDLPLVWAHRDCGPWNIVLEEGGAFTLIDWECAEPDGTPGVDLANFLLSSVLMADGAPGDPATGRGPALEAHRRMLDPTTALGRTAGDSVAEYCAGLNIDPGLFPLLRMLCWIHQAVSFWSATSVAAAAGPVSEPFHPMAMIDLVREEMRLLAERR